MYNAPQNQITMINFYYFIGLLFIFRLINWITEPNKMGLEEIQFSLEKKNKQAGTGWHEYTDEHQQRIIWRALYLVWVLIGLFTDEVFLYALILLSAMLVFRPLIKLTKNRATVPFMIVKWIQSLFLVVCYLVGAIIAIQTEYDLTSEAITWMNTILA